MRYAALTNTHVYIFTYLHSVNKTLFLFVQLARKSVSNEFITCESPDKGIRAFLQIWLKLTNPVNELTFSNLYPLVSGFCFLQTKYVCGSFSMSHTENVDCHTASDLRSPVSRRQLLSISDNTIIHTGVYI